MNTIEHLEQDRAGAGNTEIQPLKGTKQMPQNKYWFFTLNNHTIEQIEHLEHIFRHECEWYIFQEEMGEQGTIHLQGTIALKVRQRMTQLKCIDPSIHWEKTKSVKASVAYCAKEETRCGKQFVYGITIPKPVKTYEPRGWQLKVMDIIKEEPDERTINWFWSVDGCKGKTQLCKRLIAKHNAILCGGGQKDIAYAVKTHLEKKGEVEIVLINVPKASKDHINYAAIEQCKDGLMFSGKYESGHVLFNCPHVFVFANEEPEYCMMSMDRWNVKNVDELMENEETKDGY